MNRYIALLRGVNISGKNRIGMPELKKELESAGFQAVMTYLNSGNIVFSSDDRDAGKGIARIIKNRFALDIPVYVMAMDVLQDVLRHGLAAPAHHAVEGLGGELSLKGVVGRDAGEGRRGEVAEKGIVVHADHGDLARHLEVREPARAQHMDGAHVPCGHDGGGFRK